MKPFSEILKQSCKIRIIIISSILKKKPFLKFKNSALHSLINIQTLPQSISQDLHFFLLCLAIIIVFGSTSMYVIEGMNEETMFTSIPESMWWTVQTLVTVGMYSSLGVRNTRGVRIRIRS